MTGQPVAAHDVFADATVVVVDDLVDNIALLQHLLRRAGVAQVHAFTDSREAVRCIPGLDADLVLLDLHMPGLDGYDVMAALKDGLPVDAFLPVLVLTADVSRETRRRALDLGAKDFLTKPIDADEAMLRTRNLLETRALHRQLRGHNQRLQEQLEELREGERRGAERRRALSAQLDDVLAKGLLTMVFQPVVELRTHAVVGVEALARFGTTPYQSPDVWFAQAESVGRGVELELVAIRAATAELASLPAGAFLALNASPATVLSDELDALLRTLPRDRLVLELTEHTPVADYPTLAQAVSEHREAGLRLAVDDTGSGYAGLHHLLEVQPDVIKLDISLTQHVDTDPARRALAVALTSFSHDVGATVLAEGIQTAEELRVLSELGVPWGQGFHLAEPGPLPVPASGG